MLRQVNTLVLFALLSALLMSGCKPITRAENTPPDSPEALVSKPRPIPLQLSLNPTSAKAERPASEIFSTISPSVAFVETPAGTGSGALIEHGFLLSNAHVVWPFETVRVVFPDGTEFKEAPVYAWDLMADLALIGPLETGLPTLNLVDGGELEIGSDIYLLGYPAEVDEFPEPTITNGILSRVRKWDTIDYTFYQVDATTVGGQSGGILVTHRGDVIGISTFYYSGFGLAGSVKDALGRLNAMLGNDTGVTLLNRPFASGEAKTEISGLLQDKQDRQLFILREPKDTEVELTVSGIGRPGITVRSVAGYFFDGAGPKPEETDAEFSFTVEEEGAYIIEIYQPSENENTFELKSSHPLLSYHDPDDGQLLQVGDTLLGSADVSGDNDRYEIELKKDEVVEITVDSLRINPSITVHYESSTMEQRVTNEGNEGGIFDNNATIIYQAPADDTYEIIVGGAYYGGDVGGYYLKIVKADEDAELTESVDTTTFVSSSFGRMSWYEDDENHFKILYPVAWAEQSAGNRGCPQIASLCYLTEAAGMIVLVEPLSQLPKKDRNREGYVQLIQEILKANPSVKIESVEEIFSLQKLPFDKLTTDIQSGRVKAIRYIYIDEEEKLAISLTMLAAEDFVESLTPMNEYIFKSFRYWKEGQKEEENAIYFYDEGIRLLSEKEYDAAIISLTQSIDLDDSFVEAYSSRAWAYRYTLDYEHALQDLDRAIELDPENNDPLTSRSFMNWFAGEYEEALVDIDRVIELDPENEFHFNQRALIHASQEKYEEALADIKTFQEMYDDDDLPLSIKDTRAFIYLMRGEEELALEDYEAIFAKDARITASLLGAGIIKCQNGDCEEGKKLIEEALANIEEEDRKFVDPQLATLIEMANDVLSTAK